MTAKWGGRATVLLSVVACLLGIAGIVVGSIALSKSGGRSQSSNNTSALAVSDGVYMNGSHSDYPHYFVVVQSINGNSFNGSMNFRYNDGQSSVVFTFNGHGVGSNAVVVPTSVPQTGSASENASTVPRAISVSVTPTAMEFGECTEYLHFVTSPDQCAFKQVAKA